MRGLARCVVVLAVHHARAGAHALHLSRRDGLLIAHAVLVREPAFEHVADDLHVLVAMGAKARARGDMVFIDHAQVAKAHVARIVIARKREAVVRAQPAVVCMAAFAGFAQGDHVYVPFNWSDLQNSCVGGSTVEAAVAGQAQRD